VAAWREGDEDAPSRPFVGFITLTAPHFSSLLSRAHSSTSTADLDPAEVAKFAAASGHDWWDPSGQAAPLHAMNPARVLFARRVLCEAHG
jgi:hypothetical protein